MSVYFKKGKGWRYDFTLKRKRYTGTWLKTRREAREAEARRREVVQNPKVEIQTGMAFLGLVNRRLDFLKAYKSERYITDHVYLGRKWVRQWRGLNCDEISQDMVQAYVMRRAKVSAYAANQDLRYLRATFNFGIKRRWITANPTEGISFLPVEKPVRHIPSKEEVAAVILAAGPDTQDYLWTIRETMGRMGEINRLTWSDVDFEQRFVVLYTRKKSGGRLTPRKVPMTNKLFEVLSHRFKHRDKKKPWVFWHRYWSRKKNEWVEGPYGDRKKIMKTLCEKAEVTYFRYHPLRHFGASTLDHAKVSLGSIQRILGHENRTTTEIYLHSIGEAEREAMRVYETVSHTNSHTDSHTKEKGATGENL
jgi:integrase